MNKFVKLQRCLTVQANKLLYGYCSYQMPTACSTKIRQVFI